MRLSLVLGLLYFISEICLALLRRSRGNGEANSRDRKSLRFLWIAILLSIWLGLRVARYFPDATLPGRDAFATLGLIIFIVGISLRWWSIVQLGRFFTVDVSIAKDHRLIDSGPYRFVRHPSYTGALLAFLGFGLSLGNWAALPALLLPILLAFGYRIHVEEQALNAALGEQYLSYTRKTKRLVPYVY